MVKILIAIFCGSESGLWGANLAPGSCVAYIGPFPFNYDTKNQNKGTVLRVASGQLVRVERTKVLRFLCGAAACDHDSIRQAKLLTILKTSHLRFTHYSKMLQHRRSSNKRLLITPAALPASSVLSEILTTNSFDSTARTDIKKSM